ncbi:hypothetical protein [Streptomyces ginkgonis]|uniref:hypothetical protein n=1 Tax=Streptomyces ginkgonis TaxID=1812259 RepID=UPI002176E777|nr:hypothetical protein [Streptomyces ginkgonis]
MTEISYPFAETSEGGGTDLVTQLQWQNMGRMWGGDRIDFRLLSETYPAGSLPFAVSVTNGRTIHVQPGAAWVGGFYYQLTASTTVDVEPNPTDRGRRDTLVLRADMGRGSVNLAVVKGQPAASPIAPQPQRRPGDIWEMVLYEITVPERDGTVQPSLRMSFDMPPAVSTVWNTRATAAFLPVGTLSYDLDNNGGDTQYEAFNGRDGYAITRHFGKSRTYGPRLVNAANVPGSGMNYRGRWRWIAPNVVYFSASIENTSTRNITNTGGSTAIGITLPHQANGVTGQVITGKLRNPEVNGQLPNLIGLWGYCWRGSGSTHLGLYMQSKNALADGLDTVRSLPGKSEIIVSGTYETNIFNE